jgi:hypothetical protein
MALDTVILTVLLVVGIGSLVFIQLRHNQLNKKEPAEEPKED